MIWRVIFTSIYKSIVLGMSSETGAARHSFHFSSNRRIIRAIIALLLTFIRRNCAGSGYDRAPGAPRERNALIGFTAGDPLSI